MKGTELNLLSNWACPEDQPLKVTKFPKDRSAAFKKFYSLLKQTSWGLGIVSNEFWLYEHGLTIFKLDGADETLTPFPVAIEPIRLPITDGMPEEDAILLTELSVGSSSGPVNPVFGAEAPAKSVLQMNKGDKMALLKKAKKPSAKAPVKIVPLAQPKPTPPPPAIITVIEDSKDAEDRRFEPQLKKPRLSEGPAHVDAVAVAVPIPESTPTSKASSSQGSPTTCWPKSHADIFPFHLFDHFKLPGDDERFKSYSSEEYLVTYIRAQTQVNFLELWREIFNGLKGNRG